MENYTDREAYLTEGADQLVTDLFLEQGLLAEMPKFRVSVGYAPRHRGGKVLGVCINAKASADEHFEIFINPSIDDGFEALEILSHELVHVADKNESGHRNRFARFARKIGLEGKLTSTHAGELLGERIKDICELLGEYPHGKIDLDLTGKKKQGTRMLKVSCYLSDCNFHFRTSRKNVDMIDMDTAPCPACEGIGSLFAV